MLTRLISATTLVLSLAGCQGSSKMPIVVYSPHGKEMLTEYERRFEALHPALDVQWLDMGSQDAYDRVRTEKANPQADIWWGAPSAIFARAEDEGLLQPYTPTWDSVALPGRKSPASLWYGTFVTPEVIMMNSRTVPARDAPGDWDDLLDDRWRGKIIIRSPLASGTMRTIFSSLIQRELERTGDSLAGFRWLARLDMNTKTYVADPTQLYLKIAREEASLTLWDLPDVQLQTDRNHQPFGFRVPASGTPLIIDGIALVRGAPHADSAKVFYEFVTSRESLRDQAERFYRIPARTDLAPVDLPPWIAQLQLKALPIDQRQAEAHEKDWMRYWDDHVKGKGETYLRASGR